MIKTIRNKDEYSIYKNIETPNEATLSEIIKFVGWGSNKYIKQNGFKIISIYDYPEILKKWNRVTDPHYKIILPSLIAKSKGQSIIVVWIKK